MDRCFGSTIKSFWEHSIAKFEEKFGHWILTMLASSLYSICFAVLLQGEVLCVDPSKIIYRLKNREGNWMAPMANFFNFFKAHFAEKSLSLSLSLSTGCLTPKGDGSCWEALQDGWCCIMFGDEVRARFFTWQYYILFFILSLSCMRNS
jgi:hypothetical protein